MQKRTFFSELSYVLGIVILAMGTALMEKANFGLSTVVAPAYILFKKLGQTWSFLTFGTMEYLLQAVLLALLVLVLRRFRLGYLFSFVTAVLYGICLDGCMWLIAGVEAVLPMRIVCFFFGMVLCALGVNFFFHSYLAPEVYELLVKEVAQKYRKPMGRVKVVYDCVSCGAAVVMSLCFFGLWHFEGVKLGTFFCALVNGHIITFFAKLTDRYFCMKDLLPLRRYFEDPAEEPAY